MPTNNLKFKLFFGCISGCSNCGEGGERGEECGQNPKEQQFFLGKPALGGPSGCSGLTILGPLLPICVQQATILGHVWPLGDSTWQFKEATWPSSALGNLKWLYGESFGPFGDFTGIEPKNDLGCIYTEIEPIKMEPFLWYVNFILS